MTCVESWEYKGLLIWEYPCGYIVEGTDGKAYKSLFQAKMIIDNKLKTVIL